MVVIRLAPYGRKGDKVYKIMVSSEGKALSGRFIEKLGILKPGKEKPICNRHHWIFSGAVASLPDFEDGECLQVVSSQGQILGNAYFNRKAKIIGRMVTFDNTGPEDAIIFQDRKSVV